jgi:hypothetical protein
MTASRISLGALACVLIAFGAMAQDDDRAASAPPRSLGQQHPPTVDDSDLDDTTGYVPPAPKDDDLPPPPRPRMKEQPPDVDTSDLAEPEEEQAPAKHDAAPLTPDVDETPLPPPKPKPTVEVQSLGMIEGPAEGTLDPSNGGFESNMWAAASREDIENLLPRLPLASPDSAVRGLAKRLILTRAEAPTGTIRRPIVTMRIEKLLDAGFIDDAATLAAGASMENDPDFARVRADAVLTAGRADAACGDPTAPRLTESGAYWLQLRAYCAAASGDTATADITRNTLDAQGLGDPAYNILLADVLNAAKKAPGAIAKPSAVHLFLMRKAGVTVPGDVAKKMGTPANWLAMRDAHNSPEARLAAADRIMRSGAATTADLKSVLDAQMITPDKIAAAQASAPKLSFLGGQALLRRAAQLETRPPVKAALVHQALVLGDKAGLFEVSAKLQADVAGSIDPKSVPSQQAPLIGWALLLAGKPDAAARWLGDDDTARAVLSLVANKPDMAQAGLSDIAHRLSADPKQPDDNEPFEALVLGLYDALGLTMPADAKSAAKVHAAKRWPGRRPDADAMRKIVQAASTPERKGEAILRVLVFVGAGGPRDIAPDVTVELVRALQGMGVSDAARALAVHALLLYRPS